MTEDMARFTPEEVERLKKMGVIDVGSTELRLGLTRKKKHKFWDGYIPPEDRE